MIPDKEAWSFEKPIPFEVVDIQHIHLLRTWIIGHVNLGESFKIRTTRSMIGVVPSGFEIVKYILWDGFRNKSPQVAELANGASCP